MAMDIDFEQLAAGCRHRDPEAQRRLYELFAPAMLGVCMRYTHSRDEAQDLLHDGFIKVFDRIGGLRNPSSLPAWIYSIMAREAVTYVSRGCEVVYCDMSEIETAEPLDTDGCDVQLVVAALQRLPDHYRLVFNMREVEGMEYADIAAELGQPEATVRSYAARARHLIKKMIENK